MEIERKFLVKDLPAGFEKYPAVDILQGYFVVTPKETVRIRSVGGEWFITIKKGRGLSREEYEAPLSAEAAEKLWPGASARSLEKRRYKIPLVGGLVAEMDLFRGRLRGKMLVEVEFQTEEEAHLFTPPSWFGDDVTDDPYFGNSHLASL